MRRRHPPHYQAETAAPASSAIHRYFPPPIKTPSAPPTFPSSLTSNPFNPTTHPPPSIIPAPSAQSRHHCHLTSLAHPPLHFLPLDFGHPQEKHSTRHLSIQEAHPSVAQGRRASEQTSLSFDPHAREVPSWRLRIPELGEARCSRSRDGDVLRVLEKPALRVGAVMGLGGSEKLDRKGKR